MKTPSAPPAALGIELGSTRIKAVLVDAAHRPIASGAWDWENRLEDGVWTYHLDDVWTGLRGCLDNLARALPPGAPLPAALGVSAMMHGYLPFDRGGDQLAPFRTWRNTTTEQAARALSDAFAFNIPQRWSVAHLYQAILNNEPHVRGIARLTTLAGYVHQRLTGRHVLGVGDASGMFPIANGAASGAAAYNPRMLALFQNLVAGRGYPWRLENILPEVLTAGADAGTLSDEGARLLDPSGRLLRAGLPLCPPEGDAGTGMTATGSVAPRTGNVSAGTSVFAMIVLEKPLARVHPEIDLVTTPTGAPVAMVHCNNCTTDLDAWFALFREATALGGGGAPIAKSALYDTLYHAALTGESDAGGIVPVNYYSGEPVTGFDRGRPLVVRGPDSRFNLANFARALLYSAMATLQIGMDTLTGEEQVRVDCLVGHGGLFKTPGVGQRLLAAALNTPVAVRESAGEGGAWGIAILAAYLVQKEPGQTLEDYLARRVFGDAADGGVVEPDPEDARGFASFMTAYRAALEVERAAVTHID